MGKGAMWVGIGCLLAGILAVIIILVSEAPNWFVFHPIVLLLIGFGIGLIVLHNSEDKIEQRKDKPAKKK